MTFSIIIPVYKGEKCIQRCVESIISSGYNDMEIILVEDCSPDNSWLMCQLLSARYDNVRCLRNASNRGVSYTRNYGISVATGDYLLFADCDDWVESAFIPSFREAVTAGANLAICGYVTHDVKNSGNTLVYGWENQEEYVVEHIKSCLKELYDDTLIHQVWNKMFRTELVREHNIRFDESISIGEDTRFVLDYIKKANIQEITLINRTLYHYMRDQAGSLMFRVGYESIDEPLKNLRTIYELLELSEEDIDEIMVESKQSQIDIYAYLIMHNYGMALSEKRRLILKLDHEEGPRLFRQNLILFFKEKVRRFLK